MKPNGSMIRSIRVGRKLTLPGLEALTGLNRGYLSRLERDLIQDVGSEQVRRVAEGLRVPEDLLIATEESTP
ncbi:helix-turn-helix domain-containing protein (plasmid) [Streptomyces sp. CWNU-52B]|uniref:helix-turn-helix domain-containing protein n=1 Tax=unclassified Streptomyces TaxID=2593676 RepID=UPI0039C0FC3D